MEISIKAIILYGAVVLTGLSAGLFYAWSVSVIPGTQRIVDSTYLETMQSINRAILNPRFFLVFFGSLVFLGLGSIYEFHTSKLAFAFMLAASIFYLLGTVGVTGLGNVPLNNQLENVTPEGGELVWSHYLSKWTFWNHIRTTAAMIAALCFTIGLLQL